MDISIQTSGLVLALGKEKAYEIIKNSGFTGVDWNINVAMTSTDIRNLSYKEKTVFMKSVDDIIAYFEEELSCIKKNNLKICQAHAPFPACVHEHPDVFEDMIEIYKKCIEFSQYAGIPYIVIHGVSVPYSINGITAEQTEKMNRHLFSSLIPVLKKCDSVCVCLENHVSSCNWIVSEGSFSNEYETAIFIDELNEQAGREAFGLCLDTGHMFLTRNNFRKYIPTLGKRIKTLHLADNDGREDLHAIPTTGKVPWDIVCNELKSIDYCGDLSFEAYTMFNADYGASIDFISSKMKFIHEVGERFKNIIQ